MSNDQRPTIVLVPGFMTDRDLWTDLIPELEGYNTVCADISSGSSLEAIAAQVLEQCPPRFILLGFSMGGFVARYVAYQAGTRIEALILVATSARAGSPSSRARPDDPKAFKGISTTAIRASLGPERANDEHLVKRIQKMGERLGHEVYARLTSLQRPSDLERLEQIRCKCLVVSAEFDRLRSREESQELAAGLNAEFAMIHGSGHMIPLERPRELAGTMKSWLSSIGLPS